MDAIGSERVTVGGQSGDPGLAIQGFGAAFLRIRSRPRNKNIAFFSQDISDVSTIKRVHQFLSRGFTVTVLGFRRDRYNINFKPPWPHILLGYTQDGRYLRRLRALVAAIPGIWAERSHLSRVSILYARNLDQLILALFARILIAPDATLVYEVLDIQPILASKGIVPAILRKIERICLARTRYLVLSSPGFYRHYYAPIQRYKGAWLLLENKLPDPIPAGAVREQPVRRTTMETKAESRPWVIGYFGLIRGEETFRLITRLARRLGHKVRFEFRGVLTTVDEDRFRSALREHDNISYGGRYDNPADLPELYGGVDLAWAIDLENTASNSRWLLPCRLYEAGYFGVPCLAARGFELGNRVERYGIGWAFDAPFEDELVRFFETLTPDAYSAKQQVLAALPGSAFVGGADLEVLSRILTDPEWAFTPRPLDAAASESAA